MNDYNPRPLADLIDPGWARALAPVEERVHELGAMLAQDVEEGLGYLPAGTDVLRAFTYPFDEVKVLIVGQDPYPTPGHAMGLSFSVRPGVALPKSLINIFRELGDDIGCPAPTSGDLTAWSEQGVCLLNRVLTVRPGAPASHRGRGWEEVTQCAIDALVARRRPDGSRAPLVAILWGKDAQSLAPRLGETPIIASPHPSPLSAYRGFFGSRPFSPGQAPLCVREFAHRGGWGDGVAVEQGWRSAVCGRMCAVCAAGIALGCRGLASVREERDEGRNGVNALPGR